MGEQKFHGDFTSNTVHQKTPERQAGELRSVFIASLLGGKTHLFHHGRRHENILSEEVSREAHFLLSKTFETISLLLKTNKQKSYHLTKRKMKQPKSPQAPRSLA